MLHKKIQDLENQMQNLDTLEYEDIYGSPTNNAEKPWSLDDVVKKHVMKSLKLYSKIEKSEGETETVAAEIKLEPTSEEIIEYATEERKEESAVWINAKDNEGKSYWVKKSDIKTETGKRK